MIFSKYFELTFQENNNNYDDLKWLTGNIKPLEEGKEKFERTIPLGYPGQEMYALYIREFIVESPAFHTCATDS